MPDNVELKLSVQDGDRVIYFESKEEMESFLQCKTGMIELCKRIINHTK